MINLIEHAEHEMRRAGLYDDDADYGGMIPEHIMKIVKIFSDEGHSGGSAALSTQILMRLLRFKTLSPLTDDADEWMQLSPNMGFEKETWQNKRDGSCFSEDGGKTYTCVDDKPIKFLWFKKKKIHHSKPKGQK